jgi:hypothetical protein
VNAQTWNRSPAGVFRATALATIAVGLALATAAPAAGQSITPTLDYACAPPVPATSANCAQWHTTPVTLEWVFDSGQLSPVPGTDCATTTAHTISDDTAGTELSCSVTSLLTGTITKTATVRVDQTPPTVTGAVPERPPDHNGWYNHPVAFGFGGTDATSGIDSCDSARYSGPDSATASITGICRDVAGNTATGTSPLKYDATPPALTAVSQQSKAGEVNLRWTASPDAVEYTVTRESQHEQPPSTVYVGNSPSYDDRNVNESETYTYTVTAADAAANSSSVVIVAIPGGSQMVLGARETPKTRSVTVSTPRLRWRRVPRADYYNVQVFRSRRKILSAWPSRPPLTLRPSWRFRGKSFLLTAGRYHYYVWPGYGKRRARHYGKLIAHRWFKVRALN